MSLVVLAVAGGCTGVLGSFEISSDGGSGGGTNGEGGSNGADGAVTGDGAASDAGTGSDGGGMIVDGSLVDAAPVFSCTLNGSPLQLDSSNAVLPYVRIFLVGSNVTRVVNSQTGNMMAWQVSGNTKTDLSNAPQFTSVLAVKRFATSMGVLGLTSSGTLQVANIDDALTSFTTPITLNLVQKFGTGSYIPTTTVTGGTDAGIVPSIFFAGNLDPGLYAGATAAQTGVNIATGASSADMNVVNVLDSAGASFYVFTAGSAGTPAITPNKWMLTPDTVPVSAGAQAVKKALVGPTDKAAQLLGIGGLGSGNGFGVAYGEAASGASLTIRADIVSSLGSTFTAAGAPGVVQLSSTELPTGKGFEARWESTKQLVLGALRPIRSCSGSTCSGTTPGTRSCARTSRERTGS